jgi:16S rRNA (cytosine967-C5)-methyltransferase
MNPKHVITQANMAVETVENVDDLVKQGQPADKLLGEFYRANRHFGSRDRRFFSELVFAWFRWRGWIMHSAPNDWVKRTAVAGLLEAEEMHPALAYLCEQIDPPLNEPEPAGNASLEEKAALLQKWFGLETTPEIAELFPAWLPELLADQSQLPSIQLRPVTWIRVLKASVEKVEAIMQADGMAYGTHPQVPCAYSLASKKDLTVLNQKAGHLFEIQNIASQGVGFVCNPQPGQAWWDTCAGSGGKSLQLADMMNDDCNIVATDSRSNIMNELSRRIKKKKKKSISMRMLNVLTDDLPEIDFDGVLVDAPCSGVGMWARHSDARWRSKEAKIESLASLQKSILATAATKVKPGGSLVYAVCTLTKPETSDIVEQFLASHPAFSLDATRHPLSHAESDGIVWITPEETGGDAMFVARMKKAEA